MISSDKLTLIILEGPDKVGKSTIYQLLRRATGYGPLVIDRFIGSNIVYDRIYERNTDIADYFRAEKALADDFNVICFLLTCDISVLKSRIEGLEHGKDLDIALANFERANDLFDTYLTISPIEFGGVIDTTTATPKEVVADMLNFMKEIGYDTTEWTRNLESLSE